MIRRRTHLISCRDPITLGSGSATEPPDRYAFPAELATPDGPPGRHHATADTLTNAGSELLLNRDPLRQGQGRWAPKHLACGFGAFKTGLGALDQQIAFELRER